DHQVMFLLYGRDRVWLFVGYPLGIPEKDAALTVQSPRALLRVHPCRCELVRSSSIKGLIIRSRLTNFHRPAIDAQLTIRLHGAGLQPGDPSGSRTRVPDVRVRENSVPNSQTLMFCPIGRPE